MSKTTSLAPLPSVSHFGLGEMGSILARLTLQQGARTIVWNRTPGKAASMMAAGATLAPDPSSAIAASDLLVVCVHDLAGGQQLLENSAAEISGKVIIHLSTGNAQDARAAQAWAHRNRASLIAGAIQASPSQMGRADTTILVSGDEAAWHQAERLLRFFGGNLVYLGSDAGAAPTMDLATLSYVYGSVIGFAHGARVAEMEGIDLGDYGRILAQISPAFGEFLRHEAEVIKSGDFSISESPLAISIEATERLVVSARKAGMNDEFPALAASLFRRAGEAGLAREEVAALIKVLR